MGVVSTVLAGGIGVIEMKGTFLGGDEIEGVRAAVAQQVEAGQHRLLIDTSEVTFMNSAAVGVLVAAHTSYARRHWKLAFCGANKAVYSMLAVTKLNLVLHFYDSRGEALSQLAG